MEQRQASRYTLQSNHLRPCLARTTESFSENDRVIDRGEIEGCREGVDGAERFAVLVGVLFIEGAEVLAVGNDRPMLEDERSVRKGFLSGLRSLKCCQEKKISLYQGFVQEYTHTRTTLSKLEGVVVCSLRRPLPLALMGESSLVVDGVSGGSIVSLYVGDKLKGLYKPPLVTLGRRGVTNDGGATVTDPSLRQLRRSGWDLCFRGRVECRERGEGMKALSGEGSAEYMSSSSP